MNLETNHPIWINKDNIRNFELKTKDSRLEDSKDFSKEFNKFKDEIISLRIDINKLKSKDSLKDKTIDEQRQKLEDQGKQLDDQRQKLKDQGKKLEVLGKELKETRNSLFQVQLRDIIKQFLEEVKWSFGLNSKGIW